MARLYNAKPKKSRRLAGFFHLSLAFLGAKEKKTIFVRLINSYCR